MSLPPNPTPPAASADLNRVRVIYVLYALGYFTVLTAIVGLVLAYGTRGRAGAVTRSHLDFQIRTFWLSVLWGVVSVLLMLVLVGFLTYALLVVWGLVRVVTGLILANDGKPVSGTRMMGFVAV